MDTVFELARIAGIAGGLAFLLMFAGQVGSGIAYRRRMEKRAKSLNLSKTSPMR